MIPALNHCAFFTVAASGADVRTLGQLTALDAAVHAYGGLLRHSFPSGCRLVSCQVEKLQFHLRRLLQVKETAKPSLPTRKVGAKSEVDEIEAACIEAFSWKKPSEATGYLLHHSHNLLCYVIIKLGQLIFRSASVTVTASQLESWLYHSS